MSKRLLPQARLLLLGLAGTIMIGALSGCYVYGGAMSASSRSEWPLRPSGRRSPSPLRAPLHLGAGYWDWRGREWGGGRRLGAPAARPRPLGGPALPALPHHWRYHHGHWR